MQNRIGVLALAGLYFFMLASCNDEAIEENKGAELGEKTTQLGSSPKGGGMVGDFT